MKSKKRYDTTNEKYKWPKEYETELPSTYTPWKFIVVMLISAAIGIFLGILIMA